MAGKKEQSLGAGGRAHACTMGAKLLGQRAKALQQTAILKVTWGISSPKGDRPPRRYNPKMASGVVVGGIKKEGSTLQKAEGTKT